MSLAAEFFTTANRDLHFSLLNEADTLSHTTDTESFQVAENEVLHYLLEHVLKVENPYLFTENQEAPYSYELEEIRSPDGTKVIKPVGYTGEATFEQVCSGPYATLMDKKSNDFNYVFTDQEQRQLNRFQAEKIGAGIFADFIRSAPDNTYLIWSSPPGNKKDGYWDSSITYFAQVKATDDINKRKIICWRCIHHLALSGHIDFLNPFLEKGFQNEKEATPEDVILSPAWLSPEMASQHGINSIHDLIGRLYVKDGQSLDKQQISRQLDKINRLREALAPKIGELAYLLKRRLIQPAKAVCDEIEQIALANYYSSSELMKIILGKDLPTDSFVVGQKPDLIALAWQARRQEMTEKGTSCPAVRSQGDNITTSPLKQMLTDTMAKMGVSPSEEPERCDDCNTMKGKYGCCAQCPFR